MRLDDELRLLDPGHRIPDDIVDGDRARAAWQRLHAADTDATPSTSDATSRPRATRWLVPAAVAAAGALVALNLVMPGNDAYAGWTAYPTGVSAAQDGPGGADCSRMMNATTPGGPGADGDPFRTVLVEERGVYTLAIGRSEGGRLAECLVQTSGRGQGAGSSSHTATEGDPDADALTVEIYSTSSYVPGDPRPGEAEDAHSVLAGLVGPDVSSVVVNTPQHGPVQASVVDGHLAAWWPWEMTPPEPAHPDLTFDIELDDGTVRTGIPLTEVDARPEDIRG